MRNREVVNFGLIGLKLARLAKSKRTEIHDDLPKSPLTLITLRVPCQNDHSEHSLYSLWISLLTNIDG